MKSRCFSACSRRNRSVVGVLVAMVAVASIPTASLADEPPLAEWVRARVQQGLLTPLAERRPSRFSRRRPPPVERRVRVLSATTANDEEGRGFVPFAVDIRYGAEWRDDLAGCVYRSTGKIFVKRGDEYRPAEFLLGKKADPVAGVCEAAAPKS